MSKKPRQYCTVFVRAVNAMIPFDSCGHNMDKCYVSRLHVFHFATVMKNHGIEFRKDLFALSESRVRMVQSVST